MVINELLYRREAAGKPEFVELFNMGDEPIRLEGWLLEDSETSSRLPGEAVIQPGGYLVFTDQKSFANKSELTFYLGSWPGFSNAGDAVVLRNPTGVTADSVRYSPEWTEPRAGPGVSLERKDPSALSHDPSNWAVSLHPNGSTPGEINTVFEVDRRGPTAVFARVQNNRIETIFSEFILITPNTRFSVNGRPVVLHEYQQAGADRVVLSHNPGSADTELIVRAENITDFQGNQTVSTELPVARKPAPGDLVFAEIMYHELPEDTLTGAAQSEYLEIANSSSFSVSLEGIYIRESTDSDGNYRYILLTDTRHKYLSPGEQAVIYPETGNIPYHLSRTGLYFGASETLNRRSLRAERMTLSLVNTGKELYLAESSGSILDFIHYDPAWHNPNIVDTRGISLERISLHNDSNHGDNWTSSSAELGGTPAEVNSVNQSRKIADAGSGRITLQPNPFSPDADGIDDILSIRYELDQPDYLLKVRIYDRYGRLIHKLADSFRAGYSGELQWDGYTAAGNQNRIGIYIVWVEAYHSANGSREVLKEAVVLARRLD
ncbi:lamin tail domain-containing protein [Rhodohalobacter mucosus]|uniref:lamin tail domain-containing protein n=1 Tax=Rhodohalobacter mucosus TaxID=2079485 RepID=UPI001304B6D6|nr:lamin tail domain-containing protein [Rhodohalobacter mucosus]